MAVSQAQRCDELCVQEERTVAPDNTVAWNGRRLQIPKHPSRANFVRAKVRVHEYPDGELAIFHGPLCLARWPNEPIDIPERQLLAPGSGEAAKRGDFSTLIHAFHSPKINQQAVNSLAT
jgi:hypothetical protein